MLKNQQFKLIVKHIKQNNMLSNFKQKIKQNWNVEKKTIFIFFTFFGQTWFGKTIENEQIIVFVFTREERFYYYYKIIFYPLLLLL